MGDGGGRHHVGGARADGGGAGHEAAAAHRLGIGGGDVRHGLLVMRPVGRQAVPHLVERLADARHIAMAEDREDAREDRHCFSVDDGLLRGQIAGKRLGHCEADRLHGVLPRDGEASHPVSCSLSILPRSIR
jgi:hypothetical protein